MTTAEVCNSHASYLIDYMRHLKEFEIMTDSGRKTIYEIMESRKVSYPHPKCHTYLLSLILLFSYFDGDSCYKALNDCKEGKDIIHYVRKFNQDELEQSYLQEFQESLQCYFSFIYGLDHPYKTTAINSIYHYMRWHRIEDKEEYFSKVAELLDQSNEYEKNHKLARDLRNKGKEDAAREVFLSLGAYPPHIVEWYETTVMRGKSYNSGRKIRLDILKRMLDYPEISVEMEDVVEPIQEHLSV